MTTAAEREFRLAELLGASLHPKAIRALARAGDALYMYWNTELFQIGLREIGIIGGKASWWSYELFQIGLQETGVAK